MDDCLFCKIVKGEIPTDRVYEDETTLAFRDINPQAPHHILVIPKEHYQGIHDVPTEKADILGSLFVAVGKVVKELALTDDGYRLVVNSGKNANQIVPHIHVHIFGGRSMTWPPG